MHVLVDRMHPALAKEDNSKVDEPRYLCWSDMARYVLCSQAQVLGMLQLQVVGLSEIISLPGR